MQNKSPQDKFSATIKKAFWLFALLITFGCSYSSRAAQTSFSIVCRAELASSHRQELASKLRAITGWRDLDFDEHGALILGEIEKAGGSQTARELLAEAVGGRNVIVLEDASRRKDVVFARVTEARWTRDAERKPPVYVILIDFADFSKVMGDSAAMAAFNVGWGVLHEIDHVVNDSVDPEQPGETMECETLINQMRRECGLAERADYFFTFLPGTENTPFVTRFVRIAFDRQHSEANKRKRYWLVWDASLVGGLIEQQQFFARK